MTQYYMLYILLGLMGFTVFGAQHRFSNLKNALGWVSFFLAFMLLACRHESMGVDLGYYSKYNTGYLDSFDVLNRLSWREIINTKNFLNYEYGYILLNKLIGTFCDERQFLLVVCALISIYPVAKMTMERSDAPIMSVIIYLALPAFEILFSGLRQGIAVGICCMAISYIQQKRPLAFIVAVLSACLFHQATYVFLVAYPLYHLRLDRIFRLISIALIPLLFMLRVPLFTVLRHLFRRNTSLDYNGALNLLIMFIGIYAICTLFVEDQDAEESGYLNLFFVCCVAQVFGNISSLALRVGYYFMPSVIILIPRVIAKMEPKLRIIAKLAVIIFFVAFGLSRFRNGSWSMSYPYYWFWEVR